jgi:hypothetical protein
LQARWYLYHLAFSRIRIHFSKLSYRGGWTDYLKTIPNAIVSVGQGVMDMTWNSADANVQSLQRGTWLQDMGNEISSMPGAAQQYVSNSVDYATSTAFTQQIKDAVSPQAVESMLSFTAVMATGSMKLPSGSVGFSSRAAAAEGGLKVTSETVSQALKGSGMSTIQQSVSLPVIQRYVKMLEAGETAPAIKVANNVIIDGNHRFVAGKVFGTTPEITPGTLSPSSIPLVKPIENIKIDLTDFGNK